MTSIKDRLKLFENNGPVVKGNPKVKPEIPPRNSSSITQSDIKSDLSNSESHRKSHVMPVKNANELLSDNNNERMISRNYGHLQRDPDEIIDGNDNLVPESADNSRESVSKQQNVQSDNSHKEFNQKPIKTADNHDIIDEERVQSAVQGENLQAAASESEDCSDNDSLYDFSYEYHGSIYHLPGLEHFIFPFESNSVQERSLASKLNVTDSTGPTLLPSNEFPIITSPIIEPMIDVIENDPTVDDVAINLKRTASKRLIEELFNTSVWRNSVNYNDNFIFHPATAATDSSVGCDSSSRINDLSSITSSSPSNDERRKSTTSLSSSKPNIRSLFSGMFRSKRGAKKSHEKLVSNDQINDIYDSDGHDKPTANHNKTVEADTDSVGQVTKKPLNSIFNRDWLNSLGEGIKKKANVMSELKKVFTHGKTKHLKKKQKVNTDKDKENSEEDIYDDGGNDSLSTEEECPKEQLPLQKLMDNINPNKQSIFDLKKIQNKQDVTKVENKTDETYDDEDGDASEDDTNGSIYDEGGDEDEAIARRSSHESVYDDGDDEEIVKVTNNVDRKVGSKSSSHESLYDDEADEMQDSSAQSDNVPQVPIVEMRPNKINRLAKNPIFNLTIPLKMPQTIPGQKFQVKDIVKSPIIPSVLPNDSIYDDGGEDSEDDAKSMYQKTDKRFTGENNSQQRSEVSSLGETKHESKTNQTNNVKKSQKITPDFKWPFHKKSKNKIKPEKSQNNVKKSKEIPLKSKLDKRNGTVIHPSQSKPPHQNEEYDDDDENIHELGPEVQNNNIEPVLEPKSKNQLKDKEEDIYDMDSEEEEVESSKPTIYQFLGNFRNPGKLQGKVTKNQNTLDPVTNENRSEGKGGKNSHFTPETKRIDKKQNNKINKRIIEEYQIDSDQLREAKLANVSKETKKDNAVKVMKIQKKVLPNNEKKKRVDEEYDEDVPDANEVHVSNTEIEEKNKINLLKSKTSQVTAKSNKENDNIKIEAKKTEKTSLFSGKPKKVINIKESKTRKPEVKSKPETYIYDEDALDENENEVYVSDEEVEEEKETNLMKTKTPLENLKSKKQNDNKKIKTKKNEKTSIFSGKPKKVINVKESKTRKPEVKSKPETYIYDEDAPDENENEVYVSDEESGEEKATNLLKSGTPPVTMKSIKDNDHKKIETKKNEKTSLFSGKPIKVINVKESKTRKPEVKSKPETYIYDEDAPDENENEVYVSDEEVEEEKETDLMKTKTSIENLKSKKQNDSKKMETKKNEKTSIFSGKTKKVNKPAVKSIPETYIYDEDAPDENENEVYVSNEEVEEEMETNLMKTKTPSDTKKSKKENDSKKIETKKNEKVSIFSGKQKKTANEKESKDKGHKSKSKPETYIYDEDASEVLDNEAQKYCCFDDEFFNIEDPDFKKMIKKNLNQAKKVFKVNDNIMPISLSKAIKTVYSQRKNHIQLNIGELVQVLENNNDLVLVRNGVGKCGWTMPGNLEIIKLYKAQE